MQHENGEFAGLGLVILFLLILTGNAAAGDSANGLPSAGAPNAM
jgi:hypothetical protein